MKNRAIVIAGVVIGLGLLVSVAVLPKPETTGMASPVVAAEQRPSEPNPEVEALRAGLQSARAANQRLLDRIHDLESAQPQEEASNTGNDGLPTDAPQPLPFPEDVGDAYTQEGFEAVTTRVEAECELGLQLVATECSSYPCVVLFRQIRPILGPMSMATCGSWTEAFPNGESAWGFTSEETNDDGSPVYYYAWVPTPEDPTKRDVANQMASVRIRKLLDDYGIPVKR